MTRIGERTRPRVLVSAPSPKRTSLPNHEWTLNGHQFSEKKATTDYTDNTDTDVIPKER